MSRAAYATVFIMVLLAFSSSPAGAVTVPGCVNAAYSALNEYCEVLPGASGAKPPTSGTSTLASTLPARTVQKVGRDPARRVLLSLPAPAKRIGTTPKTSVAQPVPVAQSSVKPASSTLPSWLFAILAALALILIAAAVANRRRGPQGPDATSA